ncbi:propanediol utilization microcompartment protein PduB [Clostridium uliginosum]|uniref:Microcompartment protein PduB n=1 Tax=Clostridium uliginosum TaxID=119641 RepID=A0A1I1H3P0_9CLOT|nr:propanediol utilization microcompartment protein PduB [Clostridium uliginosum]SFC18779.1 microcompartment protein PduB [Clostridium uliginosum]
MNDQLIKEIMSEVLKKIEKPIGKIETPIKQVVVNKENEKYNKQSLVENQSNKQFCLTEFVDTAIGDTIGLVIANLDHSLHEMMNIDKKYKSIGIIGARTGAGAQIMSADEAVKATNAEVISVELARDTKGGAGHGILILFGAEDVSDVRQAVEITLNDLNRTFGDLYINEGGHLEFQYTARASYACNKAFKAPIGKAFGIIVGAPAAIGLLLADTAMKSANVEIIEYWSPAHKTSHSNECVTTISGDAEAVKQAILVAREVGLKLLSMMGGTPISQTTPYI